jgi:hypothetical protein
LARRPITVISRERSCRRRRAARRVAFSTLAVALLLLASMLAVAAVLVTALALLTLLPVPGLAVALTMLAVASALPVGPVRASARFSRAIVVSLGAMGASAILAFWVRARTAVEAATAGAGTACPRPR